MKQVVALQGEFPVKEFGYYEHKFLVGDALLPNVISLMTAFFGNSDPFPEGDVDSLYFDSLSRKAYTECLNGVPLKRKFRLRGYGDGKFHQFQLKQKNLSGVAKVKVNIESVSLGEACMPQPFASLRPKSGSEEAFSFCEAAAASGGVLVPCVRVRYHRHRFRIGVDRVTLDSQIEIWGLGRHFPFTNDSVRLPWHVVEVKTASPVPSLPLLGILNLPATSFSKFFLGQQLLAGEHVCL